MSDRTKLIVSLLLIFAAAGVLAYTLWPPPKDPDIVKAAAAPKAHIVCPNCGHTKDLAWDLLQPIVKRRLGTTTYTVPCENCPAQALVTPPEGADTPTPASK